MRSFVDEVALSWGWKDEEVDMWMWRGAEMANALSQKTDVLSD